MVELSSKKVRLVFLLLGFVFLADEWDNSDSLRASDVCVGFLHDGRMIIAVVLNRRGLRCGACKPLDLDTTLIV